MEDVLTENAEILGTLGPIWAYKYITQGSKPLTHICHSSAHRAYGPTRAQRPPLSVRVHKIVSGTFCFMKEDI